MCWDQKVCKQVAQIAFTRRNTLSNTTWLRNCCPENLARQRRTAICFTYLFCQSPCCDCLGEVLCHCRIYKIIEQNDGITFRTQRRDGGKEFKGRHDSTPGYTPNIQYPTQIKLNTITLPKSIQSLSGFASHKSYDTDPTASEWREEISMPCIAKI
jgi:hypothetical protein